MYHCLLAADWRRVLNTLQQRSARDFLGHVFDLVRANGTLSRANISEHRNVVMTKARPRNEHSHQEKIKGLDPAWRLPQLCSNYNSAVAVPWK